jgi:hypothetical protein
MTMPSMEKTAIPEKPPKSESQGSGVGMEIDEFQSQDLAEEARPSQEINDDELGGYTCLFDVSMLLSSFYHF